MADVIDCLPPTPPVLDCWNTRIFGAPVGRPGRNNTPISGIALHCVSDTYDGYLAKACVSNTKIKIDCHASFHYVIDAETGKTAQLVPESDLAWAFQSYRGNFPVTYPTAGCPCPDPCPPPDCPPTPSVQIDYPGWTELEALFPNLSADFFAINIGVLNNSHPEREFLDGVNCCLGPYGLTPVAWRSLVQLVAWIAYRYSIPFNAQHIAFHDEIVAVTNDDCFECKCPPGCLPCDASAYCEKCDNQGDPAFGKSTEIFWVYGETQAGCKVKIKLSDLKTLLEA